MRDRLEGQFAGEQAPVVDVKVQLLKRWKKISGITFDAPIVVVAAMDAVPAFGMAGDVPGCQSIPCRSVRLLESIVAGKIVPFWRRQSNWYARCIGKAFGADKLSQLKRRAERKKE